MAHQKSKDQKPEKETCTPLPRLLDKQSIQFRENGNTGLYWDKFFSDYEHEKGNVHQSFDKKKPDSKNKNQNSFLDRLNKHTCGSADQLETACEKISALTNALHGVVETVRNEWHFVTGMGIDHPTENGLLFHYSLGVPYLPGTAVKGLLRHWLMQNLEDSDAKNYYLNRWFGEQDAAGNIIFFDALSTKEVELVMDVMTPHYNAWYQEGNKGEDPPADWYTPVPIQFLATKNIHLQIAIAPTLNSDIGEQEIRQLMKYCLIALETAGAGAKTAKGYGQFKVVDH